MIKQQIVKIEPRHLEACCQDIPSKFKKRRYPLYFALQEIDGGFNGSVNWKSICDYGRSNGIWRKLQSLSHQAIELNDEVDNYFDCFGKRDETLLSWLKERHVLMEFYLLKQEGPE